MTGSRDSISALPVPGALNAGGGRTDRAKNQGSWAWGGAGLTARSSRVMNRVQVMGHWGNESPWASSALQSLP